MEGNEGVRVKSHSYLALFAQLESLLSVSILESKLGSWSIRIHIKLPLSCYMKCTIAYTDTEMNHAVALQDFEAAVWLLVSKSSMEMYNRHSSLFSSSLTCHHLWVRRSCFPSDVNYFG